MHSYDMESASPTTRKQRHSPLFASPDNGPSQVHGLESMDMDPGGGWEEFGDPQSLSSAGGASSVWSLGVKVGHGTFALQDQAAARDICSPERPCAFLRRARRIFGCRLPHYDCIHLLLVRITRRGILLSLCDALMRSKSRAALLADVFAESWWPFWQGSSREGAY